MIARLRQGQSIPHLVCSPDDIASSLELRLIVGALPAPARPSPANTPHPTQAAAPSSRIQSTQARNSVDELEAALERDLGGLDEDAEGEPDDEFDTLAIERPPPPPPKKATIPTQQKKAKQKSTAAAQKVSTLKAAAKAKDDGDESEGQIPLAQVVQRPKAKPLAKGAQPKPKAPKQPVSITLPSKPRPTQTKPIPASGASAPLKSTPKATAGTKRAHPEEETFQISLPPQPTRVAKRPRPSPPPVPQPPKPVSLALPSGGDGISLPGAPSSSFPTLPASINPMPTTQTLATVPQPAVPATLDSDDEDWDDALPPSPPDTGIPSHVPGRIVMEEIVPEPSRHFEEPVPLPMTLDDLEVDGEEIDEGLFEMELNQHLEEESDSDMLAYSMENTVMGDSVPISLSRAAGGGEADPIWGEYDDTSSSDDSDDD